MKIWLDIDGVCLDFGPHYLAYLGFEDQTPAKDWKDPRFVNHFYKIAKDEEFWLGIPPLIREIPFEFEGYCTARPIDTSVTEKSLEICKLPKKKIITVGHNVSKVEALKEVGCTHFLDDAYHNFEELNNNGIDCYLMSRSHNLHLDAGEKRVSSLKEFKEKIGLVECI